MSGIEKGKTIHQRRTAVIHRRNAGSPEVRKHGEIEKRPNYTLRRLGAAATVVVVAWNGAEATDYGDKIPVVSEVKDAAGWVADQIDNGPMSGDVVKDSWDEYMQSNNLQQELKGKGPAPIHQEDAPDWVKN